MTSLTYDMEAQTATALAAKLHQTDPARYDALHILVDLLAPEIQLAHRPPAEMDGRVEGRIVRDSLKENIAELEAGASFYAYHVEQIEAYGDELHFAWRWQISLPDGRDADCICAFECLLNNGHITTFTSVQRASPDDLAIVSECALLGRAKLARGKDSPS